MARLQHKKGRKSNYSKSLNNEYWREVRRKVLLRDDFKCVQCGSKLFLEVHHSTYYVNGLSIVGCELEHLEKLMTLCSNCHKKIHNK